MGWDMVGRLLDANVNLVRSHDDGESTIYTIELKFVDVFGRDRKNGVNVELPKSVKPKVRVSYTAMSSVNGRVGIVEQVINDKLKVLLNEKEYINTLCGRYHSVGVGSTVYVIEHLTSPKPGSKLSYFAIPYPLTISEELLCLQFVNADILDESDKMIHRTSADALFVRGIHDTYMAA